VEVVSRAQRLTFLAIAAVLAVVAAIVLAGRGGDEGAAQRNATATPAESAPPEGDATREATPTPEPVPVLRAGREPELEFTQGERIRFRVRHSSPNHVHVHGYDLMEEVGPGRPASFSFEATITGIFEIELEDTGEPLGTLRVEPR